MATQKAQSLIDKYSIKVDKEEEKLQPTITVSPTVAPLSKRQQLIDKYNQTTISDTTPPKQTFKDPDFINNMEAVDPPEVNNALGYAFKLGITDTFRGVKQMTGFDKEQMKAEQQKLNELMRGENGAMVTAVYFAGALLDPAGWLIPFGKAKTLYQMGKYGMVSGAIAGATGYVDEESIIDTRSKQLAIGAVGGGVVAPAFGALKNLGVKLTGKGTMIPISMKRANLTPAETVAKGGTSVQVKGRAIEEDLEAGKVYTEGERTFGIRPEAELGKEPTSIYDTLVSVFRKRGEPTIPFPKTKKVYDRPQPIANKPKSFVRKLLKGYEENVGKRILKVAATGEGGTALAGGALGFTSDPTAPLISAEEPLSSKFGRAFVGASLGYLGLSAAKKIKKKTVYGKEEEEPVIIEESFTDILGRNLIDKYGLSKDYKTLLNNYDGTKNDIASAFVRIAEQMKKLSVDEQKILYNMLEGDIKADVNSKVLKELSKQARDLITETGQRYVDLGLLTEETFKRNKDRYLGRLYKQGDEPLQLKQIGDDLRPRGIVEERKVSDWFLELKNRKPTIDDVVDPDHRGWELMGDYVEDGNKLYQVTKRAKQTPVEENLNMKGRILEQKLLGPDDLVTVRWELTKPQRLAKGEIEDAAIAMEYTGMLMANTVAKYQFYADVASKYSIDPKGRTALQMLALDGKYRKIPEATIRGTKAKKFGKLGGKYVPEVVYKDIVGGQRLQEKSSGAFWRNAKKLNSLWKSSKTAWNPTVHVNNVFGNIILSDLADVPLTGLPDAWKALTTHGGKKGYRSDIVLSAIKYGVFDADFVGKELKNFRTSELANIYKSRVDLDEWNGAVDMAKKIYDKVRNNSITNTLENWYRIEDHVFRLNAFMHRIKMGDTYEDAALFARKQFIDYDIDAPVINHMRHTVTPFLSFTYRLVPILAETAILRPHKYFKYAALGYGLSKMEELYGGKEAKVERALLPDYEAGNIMDLPFMPKKTIRLPIKDAKGRPKYLNISRFFPGGDVLSFDGQNPIPFLPEPIQPTGGIYGDILFSMIGYDLFRGQKEIGRGLNRDPIAETGLALSSLGKKLIPNFPFVPGAYSTTKLDRALKGDISKYREPQTEFEALLNAFGIKVSNKSIASLSDSRKADFDRKIRVEKSKLKTLKNELATNQINMAQYDRKLGKIYATIEDLTKQFLGRYEGIDPYAIRISDDITGFFGSGVKAIGGE